MRALKLNPQHYFAANNMANLLLEWAKVTEKPNRREQLLAEAASSAEHALQVNPSYHHGHDNLGNIRLEQGDYAKALLEYQAAMLYQPTYPEAMNDIGMLYLDNEFAVAKTADVIRCHQAALEMTSPESTQQRSKLCKRVVDRARLLQRQGRLVADFGLGIPTNPACECRQLWNVPTH